MVFEAISNEKIQEKQIFHYEKKIEVSRRVQTAKNQDLSKLMKEQINLIDNAAPSGIFSNNSKLNLTKSFLKQQSFAQSPLIPLAQPNGLDFTVSKLCKQPSRVSSKPGATPSAAPLPPKASDKFSDEVPLS